MADLQNAIKNLWENDFVQKNPKQGYKTMYATEYGLIATYLGGGARPDPSAFSRLGKGLVEAEDVRRGMAPPPPPPPPPAEAPYYAEHFDGKYNNPIWQSEPDGAATFLSGSGIRVTNCAVSAPGTCVGGKSVGSSSSYGQIAAVDAYGPYAHAGMIPGSSTGDQGHGNGKPEDTWYRFKLRFPAGYKATPSTQNSVFEFHVDDKTQADAVAHGQGWSYSFVMGVQTDVPSGYTQATACPGDPAFCKVAGVNPRLFLQVVGGVIPAPNDGVTRYFPFAPNSLLIDHWYDMVFHIYWHYSATTGWVQWWADGTKVLDVHQATLYTRTDGTYSYGENIDLINYRLWANWESSHDFDEMVWGPSAASIGFSP